MQRFAIRRPVTALVVSAGLVLTGCGGDDDASSPKAKAESKDSIYERQIADAAQVSASDFPPASGPTLAALATTGETGAQVGLATSVYEPGTNRLAFGVIGLDGKLMYGKTAVYVAREQGRRAKGPYLAPADPLLTEARYRSRQGTSPGDRTAAIYEAEVPFEATGRYEVLVLTKVAGRTFAARSEVRVGRDSPVPEPGERPPAVTTDTLASVNGDIEKIDTRIPPARELHEVSFKDVLGKRPVALIFATPQLCHSRTCGPVVDMTLQMRAKYGDRVQFIHQEVYVDNQPDKGLRRPLRVFGLPSEPWLFTVDEEGRVAASLEGSFGLRAYEDAIRQALS